jgi:hypothetical protein
MTTIAIVDHSLLQLNIDFNRIPHLMRDFFWFFIKNC